MLDKMARLPASPFNVKREVRSLNSEVVEVRRALHRIPEVGFNEKRTSEFVTRMLEELGLYVRTGVAKTGVVGLLRGAQPGRTILLRADMDALPLQEATGLRFASTNGGVMHACGHDGHMAILLTTAKILAKHKARLRGNVKFVFQPAEEGPGGAKQMIDERVLTRPRVQAALGFHLWNGLEVGTIGVAGGPVMACLDRIDIVIEGVGGHGAMPHQAVDPIVASAHAITALQTVVSREIPPTDPAVVTIGTINGGSAYNIIGEKVEMSGTVRVFNHELRKSMPERLDRILRSTAGALRASHKLSYTFGYPPTVNDEEMTRLVREVARSVVGPRNVTTPGKSTGAEDVSFFLEAVPGCYFFVGSRNTAKGITAPHHNPKFDFDEAALPIAVEMMVRAAVAYLHGRS